MPPTYHTRLPQTSTAEDSTVSQYRRDIDGLRAIAVTSVVMYHVFPSVVPGGFVGVDIFFVISGFLISGIIWNRLAENTFSFTDFYGRRVRRIFPALAVVLVVTLIVGFFFLYPDELARLGKHTLAGAFFASNFVLLGEGGYFDIAAEHKPLLHLWSLSIEEQFYLVWPLLLFTLWRVRAPFFVCAILLGIGSFSINVYVTAREPASAFFDPLARSWELLVGAMVAHKVRTRGPLHGPLANFTSVVGIGLLAISLLALQRSTPFPGWWALLPTLGSAMVLNCAPSACLNRSILSSRPFVGIGLISYPLYLWHWPIFSIASMKLMGAISPTVGGLIVLSSLFLAWSTYTLLEIPIRLRHSTKKVAITLTIVVSTIGGLGLLVWRSDGFVRYLRVNKSAGYLTQSRSLDDWLGEVRSDSCHIMSLAVSSQPPHCIEQTRPLVVLWGDSFGASLYPGLRDLQRAKFFGLAQLTASSCPALPGVRSDRTNCNEINANIMVKLKKLQPHAIILFSAWTSSRYSFQDAEISLKLQSQLSLLGQALPSTRLIVVGPIPRWERPVRAILTDMALKSSEPPPLYLPLPDIEENRKRRRFEPSMRTVTEKSGAFYISPTEILCDAEKCLSRVSDSADGLLVVDQDGHLNPKAAAPIVSRIAAVLF